MRLDDLRYLDVFFHGEKVGTLAEGPNGFVSFAYDQDWLSRGFSISPYHLPLKPGLFTQKEDKRFLGGLFGVFYDCLPDSWGNFLVDRYLTKNGYNPIEVSLFKRLSLLDENALGGLAFRPSNKLSGHEGDIDIDKLHEDYLALMREEVVDDDILLDAYHAGSSTGGSRPKANLRREDGLWIVKFPHPRYDEGDVSTMEFDYNAAAKEAGLNVAPFALLPSKHCAGYFATKRFDRDQNGLPIHMISLMGLLEIDINRPMIDYLVFLQVCADLCPEDLQEAYRMMCFNVYAKNFDDHARNFAFIYDEKKRGYRLAPFFDITYSGNLKEHALSANWNGLPNDEDLFVVGDKVHIAREDQQRIQKEVRDVVSKRLGKYINRKAK